MSKKSKRPGRADRNSQIDPATEGGGRYQIICPQTGAPVMATKRQDAVIAAVQLGTHFFYEMDDKGPFLESPEWVWMLVLDPEDDAAVIATRHSFAELAVLHGASCVPAPAWT